MNFFINPFMPDDDLDTVLMIGICLIMTLGMLFILYCMGSNFEGS